MKLLWIPHAPWHVPQRARFFAEILAERHDVWVTNGDGDFRNVQDLLTRRYLLNAVPRRWMDKNIGVHHVPRISPALHIAALRRLNDTIYRWTVQRLLERAAIDVVVGCFVAPVPSGPPIVADVFDDNVGLWLEGGSVPSFAHEIRAREADWIAASNATVVVSSVLKDRVRAEHPNAVISHVSNGVDTSHYVPARQDARRALNLNPTMKYVGNVGRISSVREVDRLVAVAERLERLSGVELLVVGDGPEMPRLKREVATRGLRHVRFVGFTEGATLLRYVQTLDVGLCPYDHTPANDARVPMRLLHYSAVGSTVVCTALEEVARLGFANVVYADSAPNGFADAVVRALDEPGEVPARILEYDIRHLAGKYEAILTDVLRSAS